MYLSIVAVYNCVSILGKSVRMLWMDVNGVSFVKVSM